MKTYVVYHRESGEIVHVHKDTRESSRKPEEVLRYVHPAISRAQLEAVEIDEGYMRGNVSYCVNPETKKVESAAAGVRFSAGNHHVKAEPKPSQT
jgi:hypothetical protein